MLSCLLVHVTKQNILGFFFQKNTNSLGHSEQTYLPIAEITNHSTYLHLDFTSFSKEIEMTALNVEISNHFLWAVRGNDKLHVNWLDHLHHSLNRMKRILPSGMNILFLYHIK